MAKKMWWKVNFSTPSSADNFVLICAYNSGFEGADNIVLIGADNSVLEGADNSVLIGAENSVLILKKKF